MKNKGLWFQTKPIREGTKGTGTTDKLIDMMFFVNLYRFILENAQRHRYRYAHAHNCLYCVVTVIIRATFVSVFIKCTESNR